MTLRQILFNRCAAHTGIKGIVGLRIYPERLPEHVTVPALTFAVIGDSDGVYVHHEPNVPATRGVARVQFACYGNTGDESERLVRAVVACWDNAQAMPTVGWARISDVAVNFDTSLSRFRSLVDVDIDYDRSQ